MPDVTCSYTGLNQIRGCRLSLTRGVTPSAFVLYLLPQAITDVTDGTLTFTQGNSQVQLTGCAIAGAFLRKQYDGKWPLQAVYGFDKRWKWAGKVISGNYNRRLSDGLVDPASSKTVQELATLLLQALGESGYDVSRMPSSVKPQVNWQNSRADLALQDLCDRVACEVVLNHFSGAIEIWPLGLGINTPTGQTEMLPKYSHAPRAYVPSTIKVVGGPSQFQHKLKLSAVALNNSNATQVLLNSSEFKPSTGWDKESWVSFPGVTSTSNRVNAFEQVWREFRVVGQQNGALQPPNCQEPVTSIDQYQLEKFILETETDLSGFKRNLPAYITGDYWSYTDLPNNTSDQYYVGGFDLVPDRRVVRFPFPIFKTDSSGGFAEPTLYLNTTYGITTANGQVSISRQGNVGGGGGTLVLRRPEVFAVYSSTKNTEAAANSEADAYISLFQQKYANPYASEIRYAGIVPLSLDGVISQVTWSYYANRTPETFACENAELDIATTPQRVRRERELLAQLQEKYL